jgi:uncharacterized protein YqjF (DUF2071 family)
MHQTWRDLLFMHWPIPAQRLRALVPDELPLDLFGGEAWITISPFVVTGLRLRGMPRIPGVSQFPELNLRTYVNVGGKPGVYFLDLDAGSRLAVAAARMAYRLPYHHAAMQVDIQDGWIVYRSRRKSGPEAEFVARYRPVGDRMLATPGTLDYFLVERYALYSVTRSGRIIRGEIDHPRWELQPAEVRVERNTIASAHQLPLPGIEPVLHFSRRQPTHVWPPIPVPHERPLGVPVMEPTM